MSRTYSFCSFSNKVFNLIINETFRCSLYDAFDIEGKYMLNMQKFDSTQNIPNFELKDLPKADSFFGPIHDTSKSASYFFSLAQPNTYDVAKYEYQETADDVKEGHIFVLFSTKRLDNKNIGSGQDVSFRGRIKKNLGSVLTNMDISQIHKGEISLEYGEGDICEYRRFRSKITLICDKTIQSLSKIEILPQEDRIYSYNKHIGCLYSFIWRTSFACSQCTIGQAYKYDVMQNKKYSRNVLEEFEQSLLKKHPTVSFIDQLNQ